MHGMQWNPGRGGHPLFALLAADGRNKLWLARAAGISHSHVRAVAAGLARPGPDFRARCARVMGRPESALFHGADAIATRFWAKVDTSGPCWLWTANKTPRGYGMFWLRGKGVSAHRVSWELIQGAPPPADLCVCHSCDTPACVRPEHLFLGTQADNTADKVTKGRGARGERISKLTSRQVIAIVRRLRAGEDALALANEFNVTRRAIYDIKNGRTWRHVVSELFVDHGASSAPHGGASLTRAGTGVASASYTSVAGAATPGWSAPRSAPDPVGGAAAG